MEEELEKRVEKLEREVQSLRSFATIPFDIEKALDSRLGVTERSATLSSKGATSEDQAVDEAGSATYNVLPSPDGFLVVTITGTSYFLPYYD